MEFRVLGPVELAAEGRRVALTSDRQRAVLAALLAHPGQTLSADRLVDAVWGDRPPVSALQSLHSHISRLRRVLAAAAAGGPPALVTEPGGYRVELGAHELDAARFEALLAEARSGPGTDPHRCVALLDEALGLWRGRAFGDLGDGDVVRAAATRLEQLRAAATADRVDAVLALGGHAQLLGELEAVVADDPLTERPHGQLMLALYRSGRQADALATYRALQRRLRDEEGIDPSPQLRELHMRILRQDPALAAVPDAHAAPPPPPRAADVSPTALIGRDADVTGVLSLLAPAALVTLTGPGGVGKSRLAEEVVARIGGQFTDGVGVCAVAGLRDPASLPAAIVAALGVPHRGNRSADETVLAALGTRRFLLVLDNCEHLLEAVSGLVAAVCRHCPHVGVLATSRERLHLPGERVWEVAPLAAPPAGASTAEVAGAPAVALFCARAQAANPRFALDADNATAVAEICRRLDGLPLAIELAAARTRAFAPADLAERLGHRFHLLTAGPPGESGRHRTLQAVVDWSYGLLTDDEARLFDRLSVFAGSFGLAAAEQVCADEGRGGADVAGLLADLVDKSMVATAPAGGQTRYRLLETMHAYATQRLADSGTADRYRRAHARHYVELLESLAPAVRGSHEHTAVARIDAEIDNLRVAQARLVDDGDVDPALRLPVALHDYVHYRLRDEVVTWTRRALELPGAREHAAFPAALATAARGALHRGELARACSDAETALAHAEPDSLPALWALHVLTEVALYEGRLEAALELADRRAALAARLRQDYYRALAGVSRMLAHLYGGSPAAALAHADDARRAADACGNHTARAWVLYASGEALLDTDPGQAEQLLEHAIDSARTTGSRLVEGVALVSLASLLGRSGATRRALELFRETVEHWRRIGDHVHQLTTLRNLVELLVRLEADDAAAVLHGAVAAGGTRSFGAEAGRLDDAWTQLESRLGAGHAAAAAERGRRMTPPQMVDEALTQLHARLGERVPLRP